MLDLLEIELSSRAHEDEEEEKRRQKSANVAIAASAAAGKGSVRANSPLNQLAGTTSQRMDALVVDNALSSTHLRWVDASSGVDQQNMR